MRDELNKVNDNKSEVEINNNGDFVFRVHSMRVIKMLADSVSIFILLNAVVICFFRVYLFAMAFVILSIFCFLGLRKMISKSEKASKEQGTILEKRTLKEDFEEYVKILRIFWKYIRKHIFKFFGWLLMFYMFVVMILLIIVALFVPGLN